MLALHMSRTSKESGGAFLLGYRGCLYFVDADFPASRGKLWFQRHWVRVRPALGSLYTTDTLVNDGINISPEHRLVLAMSSATLTSTFGRHSPLWPRKYQSSGGRYVVCVPVQEQAAGVRKIDAG